MTSFTSLLGDVRACTICAAYLPHGVRPVLQVHPQARVLIQEGASLTDTVKAWRTHWPHVIPLPHPSPRNNLWLRRNAWFEAEVLPALRKRVSTVLARVTPPVRLGR